MSEEQRFEALETKLAFQEDLLSQLNEALIHQQDRMNQVEQMLRQALQEVERLRGQDELEPLDQPPPHY